MASKLFALRLPPEDREVLERVASRERLPLGTVLRRALRWYAEQVKAVQVKPSKGKAAP